MAKTLVLVRHGKALQPIDGQEDFARELSEPGKRSLAVKLPKQVMPLINEKASVVIWSSPATRALQTAQLLSKALASNCIRIKGTVEEHESLWNQDASAFLDELASSSDDVVLAVGHNPFVEDLVTQLTGATIPCAPGALVCLSIDLTTGDKRLLWFSQGPISQRWKTLVQLEDTLKEASDNVESRRTAFFEDPDDIETMHKFRVSIRTLRSLVAFIKPWQDPKQNARSQMLLRDVVACTSRLRELDVFASQAAESGDSSEELVSFCKNEALEERERVMKLLKSKGMRKKLEEALVLTRSIKWKRTVIEDGLASESVRARFDSMASKLESDISTLRLSEVEQTHDVRKRAKRVRYAAENFKGILGSDAVGIAKGMTAHQDNLGAVCDARVNIDMINGFLDRELPETLAWDLTLMRAQNETFLYSILKSELCDELDEKEIEEPSEEKLGEPEEQSEELEDRLEEPTQSPLPPLES